MVRIKRKAITVADPFEESGTVPDYKDVATLSVFLRGRGGISSRFYTGITAKNQRRLTTAIKRARFLGLLPYVSG